MLAAIQISQRSHYSASVKKHTYNVLPGCLLIQLYSGVLAVNHIQLNLLISYLLISCYFLGNWLRFSLRQENSTPEDKFLSLVMVIITTIFWPLMWPMSCIQMWQQRQIDINVVIPIVVTILVFSVAYFFNYLSVLA